MSQRRLCAEVINAHQVTIACLDRAAKAFGENGYKFKNIPAGASRESPTLIIIKLCHTLPFMQTQALLAPDQMAFHLQVMMPLVFRTQDHHALHKNLMACHLKPL
jgi:hypothetical protein